MSLSNALKAFTETIGLAPLTPWQLRTMERLAEFEQRKLENKLLYGDPEVRTRPAGFTQAAAGAKPCRVVVDEVADFDKGRHAVALRKLHKQKVTGAIVSAPV